MNKTIFVYDSSIRRNQLRMTCPSVRYLGKVFIRNAKLVFKGHYTFGWPTLEKSKDSNDIVEGLLVQMTEADFKSMERVVGLNKNLVKKKVNVIQNGYAKPAITYLIENKNFRYEIPLKEQLSALCQGYEDCRFKIDKIWNALEICLNEYYENDQNFEITIQKNYFKKEE